MELASLQEKLGEEGWNLSDSGIELVSENGKVTDVKTLIKKAIDMDLKSISQGTLPEDINKTKCDQIPGNIVLQIQKIKNLSSPKISESNCGNSSILKLNLTDGIQNVQAIRMDPIQNINLNTFPGSKIHITSENIEVSHCFLLLFDSNTQFLGGKVDALIEKWELNKRLAKHTRDRNGEGGPPPWIGFGQKIMKQSVSDKNFKSLDLTKNKDSIENSEFEAQRKGAILEATKIGCTKVFGGGNNKLLDYNVQQIVDAGFTIEDAEYALKISKNNLDKALRNLQNKYNKSNKDDSSKPNKSNNEEKKSGKNKNRHRDDESASSLKPSGKVSLFDFLEDKLPFSEPPMETKPVQEKRNGVPFKPNNKSNFKGNSDRNKFLSEDRRSSEKSESKNQKKNYESSKSFSKFDFSEKKNHSEKKIELGKFEGKKITDGSTRSDKSFGNFKSKYETKNGDYSNRNDFFKNKSNEKRGQNNVNQSAIKGHGRSIDVNESKKMAGFGQANEKPPRFQKYQSQQNDNQGVQNWSDLSYNRIPQNDFQLQNSIANLTLQQSIANFQNQNSQDGYGDLLTGVPSTKPNNLFYQNVVIPTSQSSESRLCANQSSQPPPPPPLHQSHLNTYGSRNVGGFIHQDVKSSTFSSIPSLQDVSFKNNGPLLHGYNDFQSVFGNTRAPSNNYPNPQFLTSGPNGLPPQSHKTWIWNKGDKCMARYWEDQMYYNAVVTAVSENTCVVRFTDYGNYEEVLQDHCIPITEIGVKTEKHGDGNGEGFPYIERVTCEETRSEIHLLKNGESPLQLPAKLDPNIIKYSRFLLFFLRTGK